MAFEKNNTLFKNPLVARLVLLLFHYHENIFFYSSIFMIYDKIKINKQD